MTREELVHQIKIKQSFLCVGLDTDIEKIPVHLKSNADPVFEFNKLIIDATHDLCIAYKPNSAFYEANGVKGWISLQKTIEYLNKNYPHHFTIADAKRGDIGNTSSMYAKAFLKDLDFDSITVAPYMGEDSVTPFLQYRDKWVILLALTSNKGAIDFQFLTTDLGSNDLIYQKVLAHSMKWGSAENMMYVVGATRGELFNEVRKIVPDHFLLVPGVGAQGGSLEDVCKYGMNKDCGLIVNASRSILYASSGIDFADKARAEALSLQKEMGGMLKTYSGF